MKKIILVRHGKSSWDSPFLSDHDRPLAERGLRDAPRMAKRLRKKGLIPEVILTSTAKRALHTAQLTQEELDISPKCIHPIPELYHSSPNTILKFLRMQNDNHQLIFVVGHNPGMNDLIGDLGGNLDNLPTSGQFGFKFKTDSWKDIDAKNAEVWFVDYPKKKA
ncbi:MAG: histidine phosphatase family protein [Cyclobacteriaceae bacterium]|nr:histidine phosphatase family protein [Cyclobacteriaceae bacterium]MDX5465791.1 histidine phosphatase family protein [Cyclobacteriaceae bacterium]